MPRAKIKKGKTKSKRKHAVETLLKWGADVLRPYNLFGTFEI
jgi:hypothetical protein